MCLLYLKKIDFSSPEIQSFLKELSQKLNELDLTHIFGICTVNEEDSMELGFEYTEERKNITIPLSNLDKLDNSIEAVWSFEPDLNNKGEKIKTVKRICNHG
jgi:hypothetical protein